MITGHPVKGSEADLSRGKAMTAKVELYLVYISFKLFLKIAKALCQPCFM